MGIWHSHPKPNPVPVIPKRAVGVVVIYDGIPIPVAEVELHVDGNLFLEYTNKDGYCVFREVIDKEVEATIKVILPDYEEYSQVVTLPLKNCDYFIGATPNNPWEYQLPSLIKLYEPLSVIKSSGKLFITSDGLPWRYKGVTGFNLLDKHSKGQDVLPFLNTYTKSNTVRVFLYTPVKDWGATAWGIPDFNFVASFIELCEFHDWRVSLCLFTDDDSTKVTQVRALLNFLKDRNYTNLFLEGCNEPLTHSKLDPQLIKSDLENSGYPYTSGIYENLKKFFGKYGVMHSGRDNEWVRKAKDAIEAYRGGGPNSLDEPACPVPWILGEPIKPTEALSFTNDKLPLTIRQEQVIKDFYTYGALSTLSGTGIEFHCESAKLGNLPLEFELQCYNSMMDGTRVFPDDVVLGDYEHLRDLEEPDSPTPKALRIFRVGEYIIVVRANGFVPPTTWVSLDSLGVCYKRG